MIREVQTKYGILQGVSSNAGYTLFRGVPYAKAPTGELRWKAPQEPESWQGIRVTDTYGPACMQYDRWTEAVDDVTDDSGHPYILIPNYPYPPEMSEDCLYLNIYTPAETPESNLPVMIYIHGGGCQQWYGSDYEYCGDAFCRQGCILISVTYRLNIFGFYVHPELAEESGHDSSGNYGLMDQIAAIKWVRDNIRAFGGDPENITVFGQSAGGRCALAAVCSPLSEHSIRRISVQSAGGIGSVMGSTTRKQQEQKGIDFMRMLGCRNIAEMRRLSAETLRDANDTLGFFNGFNLYTDGYVLPEDIDQMIVKGKLDDLDIIIGCTVDEGISEKPPMFGSNLAAQSTAFAKTMYRNGKKPVYHYIFDAPQPGDDAGTPHSCDNRYQFGTLDGSWRPYTGEDWRLSEEMQKYWANFAGTGNPNGEGLSVWKPYDERHLSMTLCREGCHMDDYDEITSGKLTELREEIIRQSGK
ncbi:MAG: carboxylesterase family protein [Solobacterium sp.]|nr:carboxylesterase family protein [Solobacterium sp.]